LVTPEAQAKLRLLFNKPATHTSKISNLWRVLQLFQSLKMFNTENSY
jgi:hypothetical protein